MSRIIKPGDPGFYIPRRRYVESESRIRVGVAGLYVGEAIKPGFGVVRSFGIEAPNPNLLTDLGMNALGGSPSFTHMHLGTGTATPDFTDVALGSFGVSISTPSSAYAPAPSSPWYGQITLTWTSSVGGATGNWTEIGVSNQATTGGLRSRALILDNLGDPTVFPVQADEQFRGSYIFRVYCPASDAPATINLSSTPYDTVSRALRASAASSSAGDWGPSIISGRPFISVSSPSILYTGGLAAVTATTPLGSNIGAYGQCTIGASSYGSGNHYEESWCRWGSGQGVGNIGTVVFGMNCGSIQIEYDPVIPKLTTEEFIHWQRVSWARA